MSKEKVVESIFVVEDKKKKVVSDVPYGYIKIELDSMGKFGYPEVLHFRNYAIDETMRLSNIEDNDVDNLKQMIICLNSMVLEKDIDVGKFTIQDIITIVYNIRLNFWSKTIPKAYYRDETLESEKLNAVTNIIDGEIPIEKLKSKKLDMPKFTDPFSIKLKNGDEVFFECPKAYHLVEVNTYVENIYKKSLKQFADLIPQLQDIKKLPEKEKESAVLKLDQVQLKEFAKLTEEKVKAIGKYVNIMALKRAVISSKVTDFNTLQNRIDFLSENSAIIDSCVWQSVITFLNTIKFGIVDEVTFYSPEMGKEITRRLPFQYVEFLPNFHEENTSKYTIRFN